MDALFPELVPAGSPTPGGERLPLTDTVITLIRQLWPRAEWNDSLTALWKHELGKYPTNKVEAALKRAKTEKPWKQPELAWILAHLGSPPPRGGQPDIRVMAEIESPGICGAKYVSWIRVRDAADAQERAKAIGGRVLQVSDPNDVAQEEANFDWLDTASRDEIKKWVDVARAKHLLSDRPLNPNPKLWNAFARAAVSHARRKYANIGD